MLTWLGAGSLRSFCLALLILTTIHLLLLSSHWPLLVTFYSFLPYFEVSTFKKKICNVILIRPNERANQSENFNLPQAKLPCTSVMLGLVELFKEAEDFLNKVLNICDLISILTIFSLIRVQAERHLLGPICFKNIKE